MKFKNLNSSLLLKKLKFVHNQLPTKIIPGPNGFSGQIYQSLKEDITPIFHNFCSENRVGNIYPLIWGQHDN